MSPVTSTQTSTMGSDTESKHNIGSTTSNHSEFALSVGSLGTSIRNGGKKQGGQQYVRNNLEAPDIIAAPRQVAPMQAAPM